MPAQSQKKLRKQLNAARLALVTLLGALEKVRDLITGGHFQEAKQRAEDALVDADRYLRIVDDPSTNGEGGLPA